MNKNIEKIFEIFKGLKVLSILESNQNYIVCACRKDVRIDTVTDDLYAVDKNTFKVTDFSYFSSPDEYAEACNHVVYKYDDTDTTNDELTHWGVLGMKWGVRRYQNKDGSLTAAGKKRYQSEMDKLKEEERVLKRRKATQAKFDKLEAKKKELKEQKEELDGKQKKPKKTDSEPAKKSVKDMTDEEIINAINRKRLEDTYRQLHPEQVKKGNGFVKDFIEKSAVPALQDAGRTLIRDSALKLGKKWLGLDEKKTISSEDQYIADLAKQVKKMTLENTYIREAEKRAQAQAAAEQAAAREAAAKAAKAAEKAAAREAKAAERAAAREAKAAERAAKKAERDTIKTQKRPLYEDHRAVVEERERVARKMNAYQEALYRSYNNPKRTTRTNRTLTQDDYDFEIAARKPVSSVPRTTVSLGKSIADRYTNSPIGRYDRNLISRMDDD